MITVYKPTKEQYQEQSKWWALYNDKNYVLVTDTGYWWKNSEYDEVTLESIPSWVEIANQQTFKNSTANITPTDFKDFDILYSFSSYEEFKNTYPELFI